MDLHELIGLFLFGLILWHGVRLYLAYQKKQRLAASGIAEIDTMTGREFEQYLEMLFRKLGYQVQLTRYIGDYGADLIVCKDGVKTVVQAKRYKKAVGIKAVQEAVAAKGMYGCTAAMVVTNSTYTEPAEELARANRVRLWSREDLIGVILRDNSVPQSPATLSGSPVLETPNSQVSAASGANCALCGSPVSEKVRQYCAAHPERFEGRIYCFQHQKFGTQRAA